MQTRRRKIPKKYGIAYRALYGEQIDLTHAKVLPKARSCSHGQKKGRKSRIEEGLQTKLVAWARNLDLPILQIPNAAKRSIAEGARQKAMGLWPGASDLYLARRTRKYGGYWIEMKSPGEKPRANQVAFLDAMRREGYKAEWFDDWELARQSIIDYLADKDCL